MSPEPMAKSMPLTAMFRKSLVNSISMAMPGLARRNCGNRGMMQRRANPPGAPMRTRPTLP
jgi:hypothetical protein